METNVIEAMDGTNNEYANNAADIKEARKWKHLYLKFPSGLHLSAKHIYLGAGEEEKLELEMIPITVKHPCLAGTYVTMYGAWKVARLDVKGRKKGKTEKKQDKSDAALLLEKLSSGVRGMKLK